MKIVLLMSETAFERALAAGDAGSAPIVGSRGLSALRDASVIAAIEQAWEYARGALQQAYRFGLDTARDVVEAAQRSIDDLIDGCGEAMDDVARQLSQRIRDYLTTLIDEMLQRVRSSIGIGSLTMQLSEIQLTQKVVVGGSWKVSLQEALAVTSSGDLLIEATYRVQAQGGA